MTRPVPLVLQAGEIQDEDNRQTASNAPGRP
jgi:hypothetical protein